MSLILDALNRSRQETDPVPGLATQHPVSSSASGGWLRYIPWFALLVALGLIAWLLLGRGEPAPAIVAPVADSITPDSAGKISSAPQKVASSGAKPEAAAPPKNLAAPPMPMPAQAQPVQGKPLPAATPAPGEVPGPQQALAKQMKQAITVSAAQPAAKKTQQSDDIAQLYQQPPASANLPAVATSETGQGFTQSAQSKQQPMAATSTETIDIEKVLRQAEDEVENARMEEHAAPFINRLSQSNKDAIPTLMYQRHDYSSKRGQSKVVINGKNLRVGGSAAAGVKVDEILADSVVLTHRGTQFRLRALNSWVNL